MRCTDAFITLLGKVPLGQQKQRREGRRAMDVISGSDAPVAAAIMLAGIVSVVAGLWRRWRPG